jgi:CRP/FNR family transcriptional regulator/CRP/FNR family cyclic AMP-dependent transcriptional regulator
MVNKLELLKRVDLFSVLSDSQLEVLSRMAFAKKYTKDEIILLEDDSSNQSFFIISRGKVKVFLTGVDGREAILAILNEGEFFGEMSLIDGEPRSASVKAVEVSELVTIRREDFLISLKKMPELTMALLEEMSKRLRKANKHISNLALMTVYGRVAATILQLMEEQGIRRKSQDGTHVVVIHQRPSQQQLADMAGTTRETVSRVLGDLQKKGSISIHGKDLYILQETELKL